MSHVFSYYYVHTVTRFPINRKNYSLADTQWNIYGQPPALVRSRYVLEAKGGNRQFVLIIELIALWQS